MVQLHKKFTDEQVKQLLERYIKHEIERKYIQDILNIGNLKCLSLTNRLKMSFVLESPELLMLIKKSPLMGYN